MLTLRYTVLDRGESKLADESGLSDQSIGPPGGGIYASERRGGMHGHVLKTLEAAVWWHHLLQVVLHQLPQHCRNGNMSCVQLLCGLIQECAPVTTKMVTYTGQVQHLPDRGHHFCGRGNTLLKILGAQHPTLCRSDIHHIL